MRKAIFELDHKNVEWKFTRLCRDRYSCQRETFKYKGTESLNGLWRREWLPILIFLPGEFHGQRSLAGYSPEPPSMGVPWLSN